MKRLFGTDGIRAVAGERPLDPVTVRRFGCALATVLGRQDTNGQVVLGRDTRESGPWLRDDVAAGLLAGGFSGIDAGVITTPGLAHLVVDGGFAGGVMISASHNPFEDNGLKAFGSDGMKLSDRLEALIESEILDRTGDEPALATQPPIERSELLEVYSRHLLEIAGNGGDRPFAGLRVLLDCANGAACHLAPRLFDRLGADVTAIGVAPDGRNINLDCGSLHVDRLAEQVRREGFDLALAFDGDADRCLGVDRTGRLIDGDHILFLTGRSLKQDRRLRGDALVATVMSNYWLEEHLANEGIALRRTSVGDKYVLERMLADDLVLGGEQSGHVIFRDHATTGDGILTGLELLRIAAREPGCIEKALDGIEPYPQVLRSIRVSQKPDLKQHPQIGPILSEVEAVLAGSGRVVLRYSGTEPVARIMLEGRDPKSVHEQAERLAGVIQASIGA